MHRGGGANRAAISIWVMISQGGCGMSARALEMHQKRKESLPNGRQQGGAESAAPLCFCCFPFGEDSVIFLVHFRNPGRPPRPPNGNYGPLLKLRTRFFCWIGGDFGGVPPLIDKRGRDFYFTGLTHGKYAQGYSYTDLVCSHPASSTEVPQRWFPACMITCERP